MGALHEGHLALVEEALRHATDAAVSIFVNPAQFGPGEDLSRYPRTLEEDLRRCAERGVSLVFVPDATAMYPDGFSTHIEVSGVTSPLEGAFRPGHFRGVATVVAKLFALTGECTAVFGRKDYQQWKVIERMAEDLMLPVRVVGHPTVREPDGLAMSSRNRYLSPAERERARGIILGLRAAEEAFRSGERDASALRALVEREVSARFDSIDYVAVAHPDTLSAIEGGIEDDALIAVAARLGTTRLLDNTVLGEGAPSND